MLSHLKGVQQKPSAARNVESEVISGNSREAGRPDYSAWKMGYGLVTEVVGGKTVYFIYYDNIKGDKVINVPTTVISPGLEAIATLYGGLQPGLHLRVWYKGDEPDPRKGRMLLDVIGGVSDTLWKSDDDPAQKDISVGAWKIFMGGMTNI